MKLASGISKEPSEEPAPLLVKRERGRPRKNPNITVFLQEDDQYQESRHAEVLGLIAKGVFEITTKSEVPGGSRIFNSKFVDKVKNKGIKNECKKLRLVV